MKDTTKARKHMILSSMLFFHDALLEKEKEVVMRFVNALIYTNFKSASQKHTSAADKRAQVQAI